MSDKVRLTQEGEIAIVTIDNPPVNALGAGIPEAIRDTIHEAAWKSEIHAIVVIGAGRTFIAGADIHEFEKITSGKRCRQNDLPILLTIEDSAMPVVMAIHGSALGGGLEFAMAGHYRVATPDAQLGQPEVKLGIIPGAAGTQRLPRLVGVAKAVEMCAFGEPIKAPEALTLGLVDKLIEGDLLAGAIEFARSIKGQRPVRTRDRTAKLANPDPAVFAEARSLARKTKRGQNAPLAAIDAVEAATRLSFEEGCGLEWHLFDKCLHSSQSKAMIHGFFAERAVNKVPDVPKVTPTFEIRSAAIVGAGTMGGGIAMCYATAGIPVILKDSQEALERGMATIRKNYSNSVKRGRYSQLVMDQRMALIRPQLTYDGFGEADIVVEAIFESMAAKKVVFAELSGVIKPECILATNTSMLNIDELAAAASRPSMVIGHHFFSPANVMRLLEIVRGTKTSTRVIATSMALARKLGKVGVVARNARGFIGNRMLVPYEREAQFLLEEGESVEDVNDSIYDFGMAMGPLAMNDMAGGDINWHIKKEFPDPPGVRERYVVADRLCEMGRYGQKTGRGWSLYDENRKARPDPEVAALIEQVAKERGIERRHITREEIVDRCIYALVNAGAELLEEGIALRASDIDTVYLNGYGFPVWRGGPMFYADTVGLPKVLARIQEFEARHGSELWRPAPLLKRLAESGETFADFDQGGELAAIA